MIDTRFKYTDNAGNDIYQELMYCTIDDKKYSYVAELDSRKKATGKTHVILDTGNGQFTLITNEVEKVYILQQMYQQAKNFYKQPVAKKLILRELLPWILFLFGLLFAFILPIVSVILFIIATILRSDTFQVRPIADYIQFKKLEKTISNYEKKNW